MKLSAHMEEAKVETVWLIQNYANRHNHLFALKESPVVQ
jgi:hypothetical protein